VIDDQTDRQRKDDVLKAPSRDGGKRGNCLREPRERGDEQSARKKSQQSRAKRCGTSSHWNEDQQRNLHGSGQT